MSFGSQRRRLAALIALYALLTGGCGIIKPVVPTPPAETAAEQPVSAEDQTPVDTGATAEVLATAAEASAGLAPPADDAGRAGVAAAEERARDAPSVWQVIDGGLLAGNRITGLEWVRFQRPTAVAVRGPFIYVVDEGRGMLYRLDRGTERVVILQDLRRLVQGEVSDIYVTLDLSYFLADAQGGRVLHFDRDNRLVQIIEDRLYIGRPVAVEVDEGRGRIFVADGFNDDVMVFTRDGRLEGAIGIRGEGPGRFLGITAMTQGPDGYYVATRLGPNRVQVMGLDGAYASAFEPNSVTFPTAIAVEPRRAFVSDYLDDTIKVFVDNALAYSLGGHGSMPGRFRRITDLWIEQGHLYIADSLNGRIQVLPLSAAALLKARYP